MTKERPAASRNIRYGERLPGAILSFIRHRKKAQRDENNGAFDFSPCTRDTATSWKTEEFTHFHGGHVAPIKQMSVFDLQSCVHERLVPAIYRAIDITDNEEVTVSVFDIEEIARIKKILLH